MKKILLLLTVYLLSNLIGFGQCTIVIDNISNIGPGTPPPTVNIKVEGHVKNGGCSQVKVTLCCHGTFAVAPTCPFKIVTVLPDNNNTWSTTFENFKCPCISGSFGVVATAICTTTGNCTPAQKQQNINCPPDNSCPQILNVTASVGECFDDNSGCKKRKVIFTPTISGQYDSYSMIYGDGAIDGGITIPVPLQHDYTHYPQITPLLIINKAGCNPASFPIPLSPNVFTECGDCPVESSVNLSQLTTNNCKLTGQITANICEEQYVTFIIRYGDGDEEAFPINQLNGFQINHSYPFDRNYDFTISLLRNGAPNCLYSKNITISNCGKCKDCPSGGGDDGESCWKFWECWSWCWFLALLVGLYIATRLVLWATGVGPQISVDITWAEILELIGAGFAFAVMGYCPCETAKMIIFGAASGILIIIGILVFSGPGTVPKWLFALIAGGILLAAMIVFLNLKDC